MCGAVPLSDLHTEEPTELRNLIVNYLPPLMEEMHVFQLFSQFGPIESVKIIYDKETGESRGYGFIKYEHFLSATYAISCLNRFAIAGKKLKVAYANVHAAKEAYTLLKAENSGKGFTTRQQVALQAMYYNQMMSEAQSSMYQQRHPGVDANGEVSAAISNGRAVVQKDGPTF